MVFAGSRDPTGPKGLPPLGSILSLNCTCLEEVVQDWSPYKTHSLLAPEVANTCSALIS